jgi:hypothetical protein
MILMLAMPIVMEASNFTVFVRGMLIVSIFSCTVVGLWQLWVARHKISRGQVLFVIASYCFTIYSGLALLEAVKYDLEWRNRLFVAIIGIVAMVAYLLEPRALRRMRWGRDRVTDAPVEPSPDDETPPSA